MLLISSPQAWALHTWEKVPFEQMIDCIIECLTQTREQYIVWGIHSVRIKVVISEWPYCRYTICLRFFFFVVPALCIKVKEGPELKLYVSLIDFIA